MKGTLNENIKKLRIQKGMNQIELANALGVSKQCISNWENDNVLPSITMLMSLSDFFGVTTDYLLGRTDEETIDIQGLTEAELGHIRLLIDDLRARH